MEKELPERIIGRFKSLNSDTFSNTAMLLIHPKLAVLHDWQAIDHIAI